MSHFLSTTPLHFEASCSHAAAIDPNFAMFAIAAAERLTEPSIIESVAHEFSRLIPAEYLHLPLLIVYLDDKHADQFDAVKVSEPDGRCTVSVDLLTRHSTLHWVTPTHSFHSCTWGLFDTLNVAREWGELVLAVMSPQRVALRTLTVDDDFIIPIQAQEARCGINYQPHREQDSRTLETALVESVLFGNREKYDAEERAYVPLALKVHVVVDGAGRRQPLV